MAHSFIAISGERRGLETERVERPTCNDFAQRELDHQSNSNLTFAVNSSRF